MVEIYGCGYTSLKETTKNQHSRSPEPPFAWPNVKYNLPDNAPDNFAFKFTYGSHRGNTLDTFNGTLTIDMVFNDTTISYKLPKEQMDSIYHKMVEIDFFNYRGFRTEDEFKRWKCWKSFNYKVRVDTLTKYIGSVPCGGPYEGKAELLEQLNSLISRFITSSREYKKLPKPRGGYL